jgi:hypothetical protein
VSSRPGLIITCDAVCTTTSNFGRGIATRLLQAQETLRLIDEHRDDHMALGERFNLWREANMGPWAEHNADIDDSVRRRSSGQDSDLTPGSLKARELDTTGLDGLFIAAADTVKGRLWWLRSFRTCRSPVTSANMTPCCRFTKLAALSVRPAALLALIPKPIR